MCSPVGSLLFSLVWRAHFDGMWGGWVDGSKKVPQGHCRGVLSCLV